MLACSVTVQQSGVSSESVIAPKRGYLIDMDYNGWNVPSKLTIDIHKHK